jgi:hypothetical protein
MKARNWMLAAAIFFMLFMAARAIYRHYEVNQLRRLVEMQVAQAPKPAVTPIVKPEDPLPAHVYYGHAVVPGGLWTEADVHAYYPQMDAHIWLVHLDMEIHAHVTYKRDGKVYWTKGAMTYSGGEAVWTDGKILVLQRCGNQLALDLPDGAEWEQFPPLDLDFPEQPVQRASPIDAPVLAGDPTPPTMPTCGLDCMSIPPSVNSTPPPIDTAPPCAGCGIWVVAPPPPQRPVPMPEPTTLWMLIIGLAVLIAYSRLRGRPSPQWAEDCEKYRGHVLRGPDGHWCDDWDGLPVSAFTPEYSVCTKEKTLLGRACNYLFMCWFNYQYDRSK